MTPEEIYKKKAEQITGMDKLTAAQHLEAAAKLLRQEAGQEQKNDLKEFFAAVKKKKTERIAGMNTAFSKIAKEKVAQAMAGSDWVHVQTFSATNESVYTKKGNNGMRMTIKNGKFSVSAAGKEICAPLEIEHLAAWIDKNKKGLV